jgi:hypothetical protein
MFCDVFDSSCVEHFLSEELVALVGVIALYHCPGCPVIYCFCNIDVVYI